MYIYIYIYMPTSYVWGSKQVHLADLLGRIHEPRASRYVAETDESCLGV